MHQLKCKCGAVQGQVLKGAPSNRVRCYCTDCRAFGRFVGPAAQVLDAQGGTEIVQVCQSRLRFDRGLEHLASIRLTDKGMIRWYAQCCHTPIGNTMPDPKMSFIGLIHTSMDVSALERDFGYSIALLNTSSALGDPKPQQRGLVGVIFRFARLVLASRIMGRYKRSQLYTSTGTPVVQPRTLTAVELQRLNSDA
jgi:hypothetical protein